MKYIELTQENQGLFENFKNPQFRDVILKGFGHTGEVFLAKILDVVANAKELEEKNDSISN